jgi:hypothetical protein
MSLNTHPSSDDAVSSPCAKWSFNINAFNGNTTNFNRACPSPKLAVPLPVQPRQEVPSFSPKPMSGMIRPL